MTDNAKEEYVDYVPGTEDQHTVPDIDPQAVKKLLWKLDMRLVPMLGLLFLLAFIDRINIGNARIQGLEKDLNMTGTDYSIALFMFFIPYILLEVPSNMLLKNVRPSIYLPSSMIGWGIVTICQGVTASFGGLVACRVLIGVFEAGFYPGCVYLLSMFYRRYELQKRLNIFFSFSVIAGAFSGLFAYGVAHMDGIGGYTGWRWIFIIEGIMTVVAAAFGYLVIPDWPETSKFLHADERRLLIRILAADRANTSMNRIDRATVLRVFKDIKLYLGALMYLGIVTTSYSGAFFLPTVLKQLSWTSIRAQVMSIPIYVFATFCSISSAFLSDFLKHRFAFVIFGCLMATAGQIILLNMTHVDVAVRYFALYLLLGGSYISQPASMTWLSNNLSGHYKLGIGMAVQISIGNIGGIIASNIFIDKEAPRFPLGFGLDLGLAWVCISSAVAFFFYIRRENKLRDMGKRDGLYNLSPQEQDNLGDDHPAFRFSY